MHLVHVACSSCCTANCTVALDCCSFPADLYTPFFTVLVCVVFLPASFVGVLGAGDRKGGCARVLYDPSYSENGVLRAAARKPRAASTFDFEVSKEALCEGRPVCVLKGTTLVTCHDTVTELVACAGASHHQKPPRAANVPGRKSARWWRAQEEGESTYVLAKKLEL